MIMLAVLLMLISCMAILSYYVVLLNTRVDLLEHELRIVKLNQQASFISPSDWNKPDDDNQDAGPNQLELMLIGKHLSTQTRTNNKLKPELIMELDRLLDRFFEKVNIN